MYSCRITGQYRLDYFIIGTDYNGWTGHVWKTKSIQIFDTSVFSTKRYIIDSPHRTSYPSFIIIPIMLFHINTLCS